MLFIVFLNQVFVFKMKTVRFGKDLLFRHLLCAQIKQDKNDLLQLHASARSHTDRIVSTFFSTKLDSRLTA